jgi:hypothetical protein
VSRAQTSGDLINDQLIEMERPDLKEIPAMKLSNVKKRRWGLCRKIIQ